MTRNHYVATDEDERPEQGDMVYEKVVASSEPRYADKSVWEVESVDDYEAETPR